MCYLMENEPSALFTRDVRTLPGGHAVVEVRTGSMEITAIHLPSARSDKDIEHAQQVQHRRAFTHP